MQQVLLLLLRIVRRALLSVQSQGSQLQQGATTHDARDNVVFLGMKNATSTVLFCDQRHCSRRAFSFLSKTSDRNRLYLFRGVVLQRGAGADAGETGGSQHSHRVRHERPVQQVARVDRPVHTLKTEALEFVHVLSLYALSA